MLSKNNVLIQEQLQLNNFYTTKLLISQTHTAANGQTEIKLQKHNKIDIVQITYLRKNKNKISTKIQTLDDKNLTTT